MGQSGCATGYRWPIHRCPHCYRSRSEARPGKRAGPETPRSTGKGSRGTTSSSLRLRGGHCERLPILHGQCQNESASKMKMLSPTDRWSRRRLLKTVPALGATALLPGALLAATKNSATSVKPFSSFIDVAQSAGLTKKIVYGTPDGVTYIIEEMGGGCAFFDYDNDGWIDIFIVGGRTLEGIPPDASNRLYKNNRDGTFKDVTKESGLWDAGWGVGVCVGDYDNDGFEDLFVTYYGQNKLYRNNGNGTFTDVTARAHLSFDGTRFGAGCTF